MGIESPTLGIYDITQNYDDIEHGTQKLSSSFTLRVSSPSLAYSVYWGFSIKKITKSVGF